MDLYFNLSNFKSIENLKTHIKDNKIEYLNNKYINLPQVILEPADLFIQRNNEWYQPIGRTQTLEECISADQRTLDFLNQYQIDYVTIPADRHMSSRVFDVLMEKIKNEKTHT